MEKKKSLTAEPVTKDELDKLRKRAATSLKDAKNPGQSAEGKYKDAYDAARQLAVIAIRASGRRVSAKSGHHAVTFEALEALDSTRFKPAADYFDSARSKRNAIEYTAAAAPSETDANELVAEAERLQKSVEEWIATNHATLKP